MKSVFCISVFAAAIFLSGNSINQLSSITISNVDTTKLPPVETKKPNTDYKPAFIGQTRINGVRTITPYKVEKIAGKMGRPWAIVPLPDGTILVTEKSGYMEIYAENGS
jgi:glucose/arabinose dehydrogenase